MEYTDRTYVYTTKYLRNSKAVGVLWGVFTICCAIIDAIVFIQPQWIGGTQNSKEAGHFGLWRWCTTSLEGQEAQCFGAMNDFGSIVSAPFKVATAFVFLALVLAVLCVLSLLLAFWRPSLLFKLGGWFQMLSAIFILVGVLVYPAGFSAPEVREVCGKAARLFVLGDCDLRWTYVLAIVGAFDSAILAVLAFVLATRVVHREPESLYAAPGGDYFYKGHVNPSFLPDGSTTSSIAGSRKSINMQPMMLPPMRGDPERCSEYSQPLPRTKTSAYCTHYASPSQNFQL